MSGGGISAVDRSRGLVALSAIRAAGFPDVKTALQVAYAESSWDPKQIGHNKNGSTDTGLFQINSIHKARGNMLDPYANARFAKSLYDGKENGASGWKSWVAFTTGRYARGEPVSVTNALLNYVNTPEGKAALASASIKAPGGGGSPDDPVKIPDSTVPPGLAPLISGASNPLNALDTVKAGVQAALETLMQAFTIGLLVLLGLALIALGFYAANHEKINRGVQKAGGFVVGMTPVGKAGAVAKTAGKAAKVAKAVEKVAK